MIKNVRPYQQGDILKIKPRDVYANDLTLNSRVEELTESADTYCYTVTNETDTPIAIIGLTLLWEGVADIWGVISDEVKKTPIAFHKQIMHSMNFYAEELKLRRLQVYVQAEFNDGCKWLRSLGFVTEGRLASFGPEGKDYYIMGRVK
jgi:L-amino acid N-acyltransferase YncA